MVQRGDPVPRAIRQHRWWTIERAVDVGRNRRRGQSPQCWNCWRVPHDVCTNCWSSKGARPRLRRKSERLERFESRHANLADHFTRAADRVDGSAGIAKSFCRQPHRCQGAGVDLGGGGHDRCQSGSVGSSSAKRELTVGEPNDRLPVTRAERDAPCAHHQCVRSNWTRSTSVKRSQPGCPRGGRAPGS